MPRNLQTLFEFLSKSVDQDILYDVKYDRLIDWWLTDPE